MSRTPQIGRGPNGFGSTLRIGASAALCVLLSACTGGDAPDAGAAEASDGAGTGQQAAAWNARTDDGATGLDAVAFGIAGDTIRVRPAPRAIYWRDGDSVAPPYTVRATFQMRSVPGSPEAYGLFLGGRELAGPSQDYLYFLVRHDGSYLLKHRAGPETHTLVGWTRNPAVRSHEDAGGPPTNELVARATPDRVVFSVNGQPVDSLPVARSMVRAEGLVGIRANHRLDLAITDFEVAAAAASDTASGGG